MIQMQIPTVIDPDEAPPGYYAVLKAEVATQDLGNICRACDWRPDCSGERYRCMSYTVLTEDGQELGREDGCSVVFKRRAAAAMAEGECQHCRDDTHYRVEGDGIAVLRPETLRGCPKFRNELDRAAMAEGGEHG